MTHKSTCKTLKNGTKKWYFKRKLHREDGPAVEHTNGTKKWYLQGQLHRADGPAIEYSNGHKEWYLNGQLHRADGPAIEYVNGTKYWWYQGKYIQASSLTEFQQLTKQTPQPQLKVDIDGNKLWKLNEQLHRTDGPAIEYPNGDKWWYLHGRLHRTDGPAVEWPDGTKIWWVNGQRHRENGPAMEWANGNKEWYLKGRRHREDGPAVEFANGIQEWWYQGRRHREDGPAVEFANGIQEWWYQGKYIKASSLTEFQQLTGQTPQPQLEADTPSIDTKPHISSSSFLNVVKNDFTQGTYRVAAKSIPRTARAALLAFLKTKKIKTNWLKSLQEMMETEWGLAVVQLVMAWSFRSFPQLRQEPRALALAEEWAIDSIATVGDLVLDEALEHFRPIWQQVLSLPEAQIRVSELDITAPELILESELTCETKSLSLTC